MWGLVPADLLTIAIAISYLVLLEGLLSGDNALVLAVMVRHLPKEQQKRALHYGIWGAYLFRAIAVLTFSYLIQFWQLKVAGGLYLIYLAARHFLTGEDDESGTERRAGRFGMGFWGTVVNVELADIAFSIDSILAGVAVVEGLPAHLQTNVFLTRSIIFFGGILGITMMRFIAQLFIRLLERFQGLAAGAYFLVAWIGLKLIGGGMHDAFNRENRRVVAVWNDGWRGALPEWFKRLHWDMPDWFFWVGMALIVLISLAYRPRKRGGAGPPHEGSPPPIDGKNQQAKTSAKM